MDHKKAAFKKCVTVAYKDVLEKCALNKLKEDERLVKQKKLDQQQRDAASSLSTQAVIENFVGDLIDRKTGKNKKDNVAYDKMLSFDAGNPLQVKPPVLIGDSITEEQAAKRELTKSNLNDLKRIKSEMRAGVYVSSKNSKSPPPGGKVPVGPTPKKKANPNPKAKPKPKAKAKAKPSYPSQVEKGSGKGKGGSKGSKGLDNNKGKGKGKKGKGKSKE